MIDKEDTGEAVPESDDKFNISFFSDFFWFAVMVGGWFAGWYMPPVAVLLLTADDWCITKKSRYGSDEPLTHFFRQK
ncbi:TPA: hypothetical protein ACTAOO_004165 [Salmonella enterica subsp. enterica]